MRPAPGRIARRPQTESKRRQACLGQLDQIGGQGDRFLSDAVDPCFEHDLQRGFHRQEGENRRRADQEARDAGGRAVVQVKGEGCGLAEPAPNRRLQLILQFAADIQESRRARAAVQVFVRAADGQIDFPAIELDRHGADGVAEIPEDERAGFVRAPGQRGRVVQEAALEDHVGERQQRRAGIERLGDGLLRAEDSVGRGDDLQPAIGQPSGTALQNVQVGGEVERVAQDALAARPGLERGHGQLEQVDGGRVAHDHLPGGGADQAADLVPDPLRGLVPAAVPAADQASRPLVVDGGFQARARAIGQPAKGVAIQVEQ